MPISAYLRDLRARVGHTLLLVPSVTALIADDAGRVLLARQREGAAWSTPGGAIDPGETPADAVVREVWEETGLLVVPTRLVGVYGGPEFVVRYPNGDETEYISTIFACAVRGGALRPDGEEITELRFWTAAEASALPLAPWLRAMLPVLFATPPGAWFEGPRWRPPHAG